MVDIKKDKDDRKVDLPRMAYYMEKDVSPETDFHLFRIDIQCGRRGGVAGALGELLDMP